MLERLRQEWHYQYRAARLAWGFLRRRVIHCNLQVTYRCNFRCEICDFWKNPPDPAEEMSLADFRHIGRQLNRLGSLIISLAGGEPLERNDLAAIIRIFNEENHFPVLITNGWYVDQQRARELLQAGLQEISVSVDYASPERHDAQRGQAGAWDRAINALQLLKATRPDRRNRVHMISVLMDDNLEEVEPLIRLSRELGVTYMVNLYSWNRGEKKRRQPSEKVTAHLLELKKRYPEFISLTSYLEQFDQAVATGGVGGCQAGRMLLNVDHRGRVARCTETLREPVGNILQGDMLDLHGKLMALQQTSTCAQCWTSCRGFVESMQKPPRMRQCKEFFCSVKGHD